MKAFTIILRVSISELSECVQRNERRRVKTVKTYYMIVIEVFRHFFVVVKYRAWKRLITPFHFPPSSKQKNIKINHSRKHLEKNKSQSNVIIKKTLQCPTLFSVWIIKNKKPINFISLWPGLLYTWEESRCWQMSPKVLIDKENVQKKGCDVCLTCKFVYNRKLGK